MSRTSAREAAMKLFYEYSITGELSKDSLKDAPDALGTETLDQDNLIYIDRVLANLHENGNEIDEIISKCSKSWKFERIAKVDLAILRLALCEILYLDEIPDKVTINEAIELAKKYSAEKSYQFVNGLLGGYMRSGEAK